MPTVDLIDETYLVVAPDVLAAVVHSPVRWRSWWPDLQLSVFMDRGVDGIRWSVTGALVGSAEMWLEPVGDGVLLHYYLRVDPDPALRGLPGARGSRAADRLRRSRALAWKVVVNALKDELEAGRPPGEPRVQ